MRCKYSNQDLSQRLDNTICRYQDHPFKVRYVGENLLQLRSLRNDKEVSVIKSDDPAFDVSTVPLGYVQVTKVLVSYLTRKPARIYKQGLSSDTVQCYSLSGKNRINFSIFSKEMEDMILNKYPSVDSVLETIHSDESIFAEVAISRDVALKSNPNLKITYVYYKNAQVGFIVGNSKKVIIPSGDMAWIISKHLSDFNWVVE